MEDAARLLQLVVNGAAAGCIYGLIALGFVLIYKATEMINFAQGDIMMLGGFVAFSMIAHFGLNYWIGALLAILIIAAFGFALDAIILRRVIGQPQFAGMRRSPLRVVLWAQLRLGDWRSDRTGTAVCGLSQARTAVNTLNPLPGPPRKDTVTRFRCPDVGYVR